MTIGSDQVTYFAETDSRNRRVKFGIKSRDRLKHVYVIGKTGMGKSTLLENMAIQDIQNGEGMAFIDPHGKTAELLLEYVPEERVKDIVYFAPFDAEYPISFNVMEKVGADKRHLVVSGLMSVFEKIWVDAWSARMAYILQNTLSALLEYPNATLLGINRMLTDKDYRKEVVNNVTDPAVKSFWNDEFAKYTDKYAAEATPAIQNKVGQFANNAMIRNIVGQPRSSFDFRQIMDEGKILIINLSKGLVGENNAKLLGGLLITKIYLAAMSRADVHDSKLQELPNFYLYVDEFQSFANKSFADILSEARKYKLNLTIAHQYIEQMEEEVRAAVFGNVGTMITFRVGAYDAEILEKEFSPTFTAEDLVNLGSYQIYLKLMIDGVSSQPFSAVTIPPLSKPDMSRAKEVIENSRTIYAMPKEIVEKRIREWHEEKKDQAEATSTKGELAVKKSFESSRFAPKAIDIRGKKGDPKQDRGSVQRSDKAEIPSQRREQEFRPTQPISLKSLVEKKTDNQRKPDPKHISDLREALKAVVGSETTSSNQQPTVEERRDPLLDANSKQQEAKREPSVAELKKILDGS
jgi:energy-coupling factor transporter ATP-binding protein EcfA2